MNESACYREKTSRSNAGGRKKWNKQNMCPRERLLNCALRRAGSENAGSHSLKRISSAKKTSGSNYPGMYDWERNELTRSFWRLASSACTSTMNYPPRNPWCHKFMMFGEFGMHLDHELPSKKLHWAPKSPHEGGWVFKEPTPPCLKSSCSICLVYLVVLEIFYGHSEW